MNEPLDDFTMRLQELAGSLEYPPTPDLVRKLRSRRSPRPAPRPFWRRPSLGLALALILMIAALLAVPPVRAAVLEWIQIGVVRIFIDSPPATGTPAPPSSQLPSWLKLAGQSSLAQAAEDSGLPLLVPAEGSELGSPDAVFYQEANGRLVILAWSDPSDSEALLASLLILGPETFAGKGSPETVVNTSVRGRPALWLQGDHLLYLQTSENEIGEVQLSVSGSVLLWEEAGFTYRLEGDFSLEQAKQLVDSLKAYAAP